MNPFWFVGVFFMVIGLIGLIQTSTEIKAVAARRRRERRTYGDTENPS